MRLILAVLLPFVVFFTIGRPFQGILCLLLQMTLIGWIPAAIRAFPKVGGITPSGGALSVIVCSVGKFHHYPSESRGLTPSYVARW